jgi:uncharacterized membrane protein YsdA (DUF1294 family)/cold shock CspA family protein
MRNSGKIVSWNDCKGYGFIAQDSGQKQIFVHIKAFRNRSYRPTVGEVVDYDISSDSLGRPRAENATFPGNLFGIVKEALHENSAVFIALGAILAVAVSVAINEFPLMIAGVYPVLSLLTFLVYAKDKSAAKKGKWRTPESTLHLLAFAGGWPGALIAQQKLRHKSQKQSFRFVFWITVVLNCSVFVWISTEKGAEIFRVLLQRNG